MTEIDMARQHGHNMEVEFVNNKDAFNIGYKSFLAGYNKSKAEAKEHIESLLYYVKQCTCERSNYAEIEKDIKEAEQFIK